MFMSLLNRFIIQCFIEFMVLVEKKSISLAFHVNLKNTTLVYFKYKQFSLSELTTISMLNIHKHCYHYIINILIM